ncbi:MAG TPA: carboxymuconolactone decarboxylase family protein [Gemmatimonadales bacterium]|nr:carboxymuconolactone decarboxylase family protein [Gemmatimonadales bacterium]
METYLPPIERPHGLVMKLVYALAKRRFGQVLTPLKVFSARMPLAFGTWVGKVSQLDNRLSIPTELVHLIRQQVAQINVCEFCIDIGRWAAMQASDSTGKLDALAEFETSPVFSDAERAALNYVTHLTRFKKVSPAVFNRMAEHFSDREICDITWVVASEHVYNISNIGLNIHSDGLCRVPAAAGAA